MRIDSHQHVFWHGRDAAGLVADMDEHGIDEAWLLSWDVLPDECNLFYNGILNPAHMRADGTHAGIPLADLLLARDRYPDRFVVGYCPNPRHPKAPELLAAAHSMHGIRVCGEWKFRLPLDDPRCIEVFRVAGRLKLPVVLHLDVPWLPDEDGRPIYQEHWYGGTVADLERALQVCPETTFIGHAPGFWREISGLADTDREMYPMGEVTAGGRLYTLFDGYANLLADLSAGSAIRALRRDEEHARDFVIRYADRLLFGRDFYGGDLLDLLKALDLPADVQAKLYSENALKLVPSVRAS